MAGFFMLEVCGRTAVFLVFVIFEVFVFGEIHTIVVSEIVFDVALARVAREFRIVALFDLFFFEIHAFEKNYC